MSGQGIQNLVNAVTASIPASGGMRTVTAGQAACGTRHNDGVRVAEAGVHAPAPTHAADLGSSDDTMPGHGGLDADSGRDVPGDRGHQRGADRAV